MEKFLSTDCNFKANEEGLGTGVYLNEIEIVWADIHP
jgi:hypothetical protein